MNLRNVLRSISDKLFGADPLRVIEEASGQGFWVTWPELLAATKMSRCELFRTLLIKTNEGYLTARYICSGNVITDSLISNEANKMEFAVRN